MGIWKIMIINLIANISSPKVILRRGPGYVQHNGRRISFEQTYEAYRRGFGNRDTGEYFLGLDAIQAFTRTHHHQLKVDIVDKAGHRWSFVYDNFVIGPPADNYRLYVSGLANCQG